MRAWILLLSTSLFLFGTSGCESKTKSDEKKAEKPGTVCNIDDDCSEGESCIGRRCKKVTRSGGEEEGPAQEAFAPGSDREKLLLFAGIGKEEYLDTLKQRAEVFRNINSKPITYAPHKTALRGILTKLEEFQIGLDPEDLEDAPARVCALLEETRKTANGIWTEAGKKVEEYDSRLSLLDMNEKGYKEKLAKKGRLKRSEEVARKKNNTEIISIEGERKHWINTQRVLEYFGMVLKNILRDGYSLAHIGAKRTQEALTECLTPLQKRKFEFDNHEVLPAQFERVLKRASTYVKK